MFCRSSKRSSLRSSFRTAENGAALVVALLVFALAAALMVGLQRDFTLQLQRATNSSINEQIWAYLMGAEALAKVALRADVELDAQSDNAVDDLNEIWAQPAQPYPLDEGGWLAGGLTDLQGLIPINELGSNSAQQGGQTGDPTGAGTARFTTHQQMMIRLLQSLDGVEVTLAQAIAITEAISDFVDADGQRRSEGAEDDTYRSGDFPYLAANRALASVSELRAVQGMTPEIFRAMAPFVSVWPEGSASLNWRTAPLPVLRTFNADDSLEPMPLEEAQRIGELRAQGLITDLDTLFDDVFFLDRTTAELRGVLGDRSSWFLLNAEVQIADRVRRLYSVLRRNGRSITVVFRTDGEV